MRKFVLAAAVLFAAATAGTAAPVRFVKFDDKTKAVTVKTGKKGKEVEKTYTLTDKAKFLDGDKEIKLDEAVKKFAGAKAVKTFDIKADGDKVEEVKFTAAAKKKPKKADK